MLVSLLRMRYILKALQKLSALDLVPSKAGGCFPRRLVLSSAGVVIVAWAVTGWADMVVIRTWLGAVDDVGFWAATGARMTGSLDGVRVMTRGVIGDDNNVGLLVIP